MLKSWTCKAAPAGRGAGGVRRGQRGAGPRGSGPRAQQRWMRGAQLSMGTRGPFRLWRPCPGVARPPGSLTPSLTSRSPGWSHPRGRRRVCNQKTGLHLLASSSHGEPDPQMSPPGPRQPVRPGSLSPPILFRVTPHAACPPPASRRALQLLASFRPYTDSRLRVHPLCPPAASEHLAWTLAPWPVSRCASSGVSPL